MCVSDCKVHKGVVVAPHLPRTEGGLYWGYSVRLASCLSEFCPFIHLFPLVSSITFHQLVQLKIVFLYLCVCVGAVFTECPYKDGYDLTIGTSEKGKNADHVTLSPFK